MSTGKEDREVSVVVRVFRLCAEVWIIWQIAKTLNSDETGSIAGWVWDIAALEDVRRTASEIEISEKKRKAAVYLRVSSLGQDAAESLKMQEAECMKFARSLGYEVDAGCVYREIGSGASVDRPQFARLRGRAAAGGLGGFFVYSVDRLSRNPADLLALVKEFDERGVKVHFVHGASDSTPEERASARGGWLPTGARKQLYGYHYDPVAKRLVVNEPEARVVERIFRLYAAGWSVSRIAKTLNADGVPSRTAGFWTAAVLRLVLLRTSDVGVDGQREQVAAPREELIEMNGCTAAIISEALFQKVQERLGEVQARFRGDRARSRLLVGSVRCGSCEASMAVRVGAGKGRHYWCSEARRSGAQQGAGQGECWAQAINAVWLEDQVWSHVVAIVRDPSGIIADLELNCRTRAGELGQEIERLRGEVQKVEQQEVRLLDLCRSGTFRLELLVARMEGLSTLLVDLRARLAELDEQRAREENALAACERVREYCLMVSASLEGLDVACKRDVMMRLGVKVLVVQGEVTITAEIDLDLW